MNKMCFIKVQQRNIKYKEDAQGKYFIMRASWRRSWHLKRNSMKEMLLFRSHWSSNSSHISPAKRTTFRKFRDNKLKKTPKRLQRNKQPQFNDNAYVQKLVRSIKRRNLPNITTSGKKQTKSGRKLKKQLKKVRKSLLSMPTAKQKLSFRRNETYEEGELLSSEDDDADCMIVEPSLDPIVIDDDEPSTSQFSAAMALAMSTPYKPTQTAAREQNSGSEAFFTDTKSNPTLKYNDSIPETPMYSKVLHKLTDRNECSMQSTDVVVIDEIGEVSFTDSTKSNPDDSVIFVPLVSNNVPNPIIAKPEQQQNAPAQSLNHSFFSKSEQKALRAYNSNAYNPAGDFCGYKREKKRTVLIDGSNVAYGHSRCKEFSVEGLKICIDYFDKMGHEVKAVVPQFRKNANKSSNPELLDKLHQLGKVVFTPCKNLPGMVSISYDDRFVLQLACELDAAIISNDNYRDLIHESAAFKKLIENRVIGYTWCNDIFILPKDPYGRWGPTLDIILNRS